MRNMLMRIVTAAQAKLNMRRTRWRVNGPRTLTGLTTNSSQFEGSGQPEVFCAMAEAAIGKAGAFSQGRMLYQSMVCLKGESVDERRRSCRAKTLRVNL